MNIGKKIIKHTLIPLFLLCSCNNANKQEMVKVVLEDGDYKCSSQIMSLPKGSDFTFDVILNIDKAINGSSYANYTISEEIANEKRYDKITFHSVDYSTFISLFIVDSIKINYDIDGTIKSEYVIKNHERINTSNDYETYRKEGYCLSGWLDDSNVISLGSRVDVDKDKTLKARYLKESDPSLFEYDYLDKNNIKINRYIGEEKVIVIPQKIDDHHVVSIDKGAFTNLDIDELILATSLSIVFKEAFVDCQIKQLVFFDNLISISDESFTNCRLEKIRINAVKNPCYARNYFGAYPEKFDRLYNIKDKKKIVLYGGSSVRFGFNSELIDETFKEYDVVDMGVFAYSQGYPQLDIINMFTNKDDMIIATPEFDTINNQIDLKPVIDDNFIAMCESNYDILSLLDFSKYTNFFNAFTLFQRLRDKLPSYPYTDTAYQYDEDGNYVNNHSYNKYGDYVVYRKNNEERVVYGVEPAYYNIKYFPMTMIDNFNNAFESLREKGVKLIYDYSPRSNIAISKDSSVESAKELDSYLKKNVNMTFISNAEDSLLDAYYFYGTDNHLSTEGVNIRTKRVVNALLNGHYI